ncbi:hypothetical protein GS416_02765, partial [Rhodococcus hoagii]|nr:hypothetical protein [Prescottella equi]
MSADHLPAAPMLDDAVAGLPVTAAQSEILVAQQLDPQSTVYKPLARRGGHRADRHRAGHGGDPPDRRARRGTARAV